MRWLKEWWDPSLKCKRIGHVDKEVPIKIRKEGGSYRSVVTDYSAKLKICARCAVKLCEPYDLEFEESFTGCEMPTHMWNEIREKGFLLLN